MDWKKQQQMTYVTCPSIDENIKMLQANLYTFISLMSVYLKADTRLSSPSQLFYFVSVITTLMLLKPLGS